MGTREQVERGILVYTCNCGWLDTTNADTRARRPNLGAENLWRQINAETGITSQKAGERGFKVSYTHDLPKRVTAADETRAYFVKRGLDVAQKESVALAIFIDVLAGVETLEGSFPASWVYARSRNPSLSEDDLVSDLIGLYVAVRPGIDVKALCKPVSQTASLAIWNTYGSVGSDTNHTFNAWFHPCDECRGPGRFPAALQQIMPANKGTLFRDWKWASPNTAAGGSDPTGTVDEIVSAPQVVPSP